ncbi:MAG: cbb3-type cytochrome oxidase assembly protein CcoS [bacterium]|nr:cbb3-type cytochrome oxidase assembly protein CcoS [bacterium]
MSVLYIALPIALLLGAAGLWACIITIRSGQYDDLDSPPLRMLIDDKPPAEQRGHQSLDQAE